MTNYPPDAIFYEGSDIELEQDTQTLDLQLPGAINGMFIGVWLLCLMVALAVIFFMKNTSLGILIIGIPTFIGMVLKPTFALSVVMIVLPAGAGFGIQGVFSLDRGVGIALAMSFLLNAMVTRPRFKLSHSFLLIQMVFVFWVATNLLRTPVLSFELEKVFTQIQMLGLTLITYWILQNSTGKTYVWVLRSYIAGSLGSILLGLIIGAPMSDEVADLRFGGVGTFAIDSNVMSALTALGIITSIYLIVRDKSLLWRLFYLMAIICLPVMMVRTGSRGGAIAFIATILSPLLFVRQVGRKPMLYLVLIFAAVIMAVAVRYVMKSYSVEESVAGRFSDVGAAYSAISTRFSFIQHAIEEVSKNPLGTTFEGWKPSGAILIAHSDFFHLLGTCGYPGALLFVLLIVSALWTIKRMPVSIEKFYARSIIIFLIVFGMDIFTCFDKYFWIFMIIAICAERMNIFYHQPSVSNTDEHQVAVEQSSPAVWNT